MRTDATSLDSLDANNLANFEIMKRMRILSLDGGGYLGLTTAAFLEELERHFGARCSDRFDLFCGTSTGAIIALALAAGFTARDVRLMYEDFGPKVFWNPFPGMRFLRAMRGLLFARYSNRALRRALEKAFGTKTLGDVRRAGKFVVVPAFKVSSGTPRIFKTNHGPDLTQDDDWLLSDIALASSAAPVYLPIVQLKSPMTEIYEEYCDGGVFANYPALVGYTEALYHLNVRPEDVYLLSLSTPRGDLAQHPSQRYFSMMSRGLLKWGSSLTSILIDSTSEIGHQSLRRLTSGKHGAKSVYERFVFRKPQGVALDLASRNATTTLRNIGCDAASQTDTRERVRQFFEG